MNFSQRSYQQELLDRADIPFNDIRKNMRELDFINRWLGGHKITLAGFKMLLQKAVQPGKTLSVCEIGCGGGDNLRVIKKFCARNDIQVQLTGIDINPNCIQFAESRRENEGIRFITSDYKLVKFEKKDIIFSSLFCHHFNDEQVMEILCWMKENSRVGFFINDLHRHPLAYYSIKWLTRLFSGSYLVKNDAPLSVRRGFKRSEWRSFFAGAGFGNNNNPSLSAGSDSQLNTRLLWKWAFRWLIVYKHE